MAPIPPWTLYIGAGWSVDTQDRPKVVETKIVEKETAAAPGSATSRGTSTRPGSRDGRPERDRRVREPPGDHVARVRAGRPLRDARAPARQVRLRREGRGLQGRHLHGDARARLPPPTPRRQPPAPDATRGLQPSAAAAPPHRSPGISDASVTCSLEALPRIGKVDRPRARRRDPQRRPERRDQDGGLRRPRVHADLGHERGLPLRRPRAGGYQLTASADGYLNDVESVDVKPRVGYARPTSSS